ncbi:M56 family metallopeptidase [Alteromonas sp. ASW11-19]|uniref:Protein TonB n=1 Tax=Alteromonas salexigens TaxID=2982530 RepID=A0ABT2VN14_9ALTE|nr:M56 family metallopeptidase [Alteromonas salexigens]MCU7553349.1 M56 family metallopeptidase [Alteromonas salexigens]
MTDWLVQQQALLSVTLIVLMVLEHIGTPKLGARLAYVLWLAVPLTLLAGNLPLPDMPAVSGTFSRYVVGVTPQASVTQLNLFGTIWGLGAVSVLSFVAVHYVRLARAVGVSQGDHRATYYCKAISSPLLFGFVQPKILLPENFSTQYSPRQQQLIIEHERVHARRFDRLWNFLALCVATLFWFNPLVWLALRSFRINQELACDQQVLATKPDADKLLYAKALVQCAEHSSAPVGFYPTFGEKSTMLKRLNLIKRPGVTNKAVAFASLLILGTVTASAALANLPTQHIDAAKINKAAPVKRVSPVYPDGALTRNQEGSVVLQFDITESGHTDNIHIVKSHPAGVFDSSAEEALSQWQYKPRIQGGQPQRQSGLLVQLDFKLGPDDEEKDTQSKLEKISVYSQ